MRYFDENQVAFWRKREVEERGFAARSVDEKRVAHLRLADSYAALIAQTIGDVPKDANE